MASGRLVNLIHHRLRGGKGWGPNRTKIDVGRVINMNKSRRLFCLFDRDKPYDLVIKYADQISTLPIKPINTSIIPYRSEYTRCLDVRDYDFFTRRYRSYDELMKDMDEIKEKIIRLDEISDQLEIDLLKPFTQNEQTLKEKALFTTDNKHQNKKGSITICNVKPTENLVEIDGSIDVFTNIKDKHRMKGFVCSSLSPRSLGPIDHGMPNLPPARSLSNYYQFAMIYDFETKKDAFQLRKEAYASDIAYSCKYPEKVMMMAKQKNLHQPTCSLYYTKTGKKRYYDNIQARYFFCHWYEKLVHENKDFIELKRLRDDGCNLRIISYTKHDLFDDLNEYYLNPFTSFSHEFVLYVLLTIEDRNDYPWNLYYNKNKGLFKDVIGN